MKKLTLIIMSALLTVTLLSEAKESKDAKIYSKAKFIRLRKGVNVFGGGGNVCFRTIPEKFEGRKITLRVRNSSDPLEFEVKEAGIVTLVAEPIAAKKLIGNHCINESISAYIVGSRRAKVNR